MQKATLLTLALSVSALFASAQSLKTFTAGKVYSIKNKNHSAYAAAMPQTSDMACSSTLNLACLFTITPVEGSEGVYTIKPYADNTKVVYSIKVANDNNTVGIKASDDADNTKWKIAATDATNTNYVTITSSTKPTATDGYWNHRGTNADWNLVGIGGYTAKSVADNPGSYWTIAEVSNEEIETAKTNFANIYSTILAGKIGEQVGYYSKTSIDEVQSNITNATDNKTAYNAAKPLAQLVNLPVDGKVYKICGLYNGTEKIYAGTQSSETAKYYVAQKTSGTNVYRFVSTTADAEALTYNDRKDFTVGVTNMINLGALTLTYGNVAVAVASNGTLNHFTGKGNNTLNNDGVKYSTEMYFEEVTSTDYAGHSVVFASSNTDNKRYATLNLPFATTIPEGVTAYKKVGDTGASVKLDVYKNANEVLPANTPVLLQTANTFATFAPAPYVAQEATGFSGTLAPTAVTGNAYILANDGGAVKFCKLSTTKNTVNPNKAYLTLPAASATALNFDFGGVATGIENAVAEKANNAPIYDLSGRRVMNAVKGGIYIQNGKKFVK